MSGYTYEEFVTAFWKRVDMPSLFSCWDWMGPRNYDDYGLVKRKGKTLRCHRVSWEYIYGDIPNGLWVLHCCDNPKCCNPVHLFLGTHKDNMRDMTEKNRGTRGERSGLSKLTIDDVFEIFTLREKGLSHQRIADRFPVKKAQITRILNGQRWPHAKAMLLEQSR